MLFDLGLEVEDFGEVCNSVVYMCSLEHTQAGTRINTAKLFLEKIVLVFL